METFDCAILFEWEYDDDFVAILSRHFNLRAISHKTFCPNDFEETLQKILRGELSFKTVFDRASDVDEKCESLVSALLDKGTRVINDPSKVRHSSDKASMHLEFISAGIQVPYTIIISPYSTQKEVSLSTDQLTALGKPFIIKPANTTGGGIGVVTGAESLREVIETRRHHENDKYLLQRKIEPAIVAGKRAWFRPFYVFGKVFTCWWDDLTHLYFEMSEEEKASYNFAEVERIVRKIHDICELDFFSTEIAITSNGDFVVIDYVNEMCDMRVKSKHYDGVPDTIVEQIADQIAAWIEKFEPGKG
jgi:glutathione synthase/RimK-type ligase-like ATP-grasp enzyme